ncbi:MAG: hypothetical protein KC561_11365 [Myxococcales bacterium]|nr:hypothetical protein [Myxococcales bacterium]
MAADISINGPDETPFAVFEVKARRGMTSEWAAQFRRNLAVHVGIPPAKYFGMVTPDRLFLWDTARDRQDSPTAHFSDRLPDFTVDMDDYFSGFPNSAEYTAQGETFEMLVTYWLNTLLRGEIEGSPKVLEESGFLRGIRSGHVNLQSAREA